MQLIERELQKGFSNRKIGSITRCAEPLVAPFSAEWARKSFADEGEDAEALPVEVDDIVVGMLEREAFFASYGKRSGEIGDKELAKLLGPQPPAIRAEDFIENVFDEVMRNPRASIPRFFLVYHKSSYMGYVSFLQIVRQINALRVMDLDKASEVQNYLLGKAALSSSDAKLACFNKMAGRVGGDFHVAYEYGDGDFLAGCFDVSGKGFAASLSTIIIGSFFTSLSINDVTEKHPAKVTERLDTYVKELSPEGTYIAAALAFYSKAERKLCVQNCGMPPVYIFMPAESKTSVKILKPNLPPLGLGHLDESKQTFAEFQTQRGMRVVMFSDGLADLRGPYGEQFGEEAVHDIVLKGHGMSQADFIASLDPAIESFRDGAPQADDITVLDLRFN